MPRRGSGMPQMGAAFNGWFQNLTFIKRVQEITDDGLVSYVDTNVSFQGTIQPLSPRQIALKPEGQRAWTWLQVHCLNNDIFKTNDQVTYNGVLLKVMARLNFTLNGYIEYHLVQDFQP